MMLIRWLIWVLIVYIGYRVIKSLLSSAAGQAKVKGHDRGEETVQDPVCGMFVAREDAVVGVLEGKRLYFCSMDCLDKFRDQLEHQNK
jgi:YHS domain-containing protein